MIAELLPIGLVIGGLLGAFGQMLFAMVTFAITGLLMLVL